MSRVLVTGALGAIGAWTLRSLLDRGHDVVALDAGDDRRRLPVALDATQRDAVVHVRGDVTDLAALERVLDEHDVTAVVHLAALQVPFVRADPPRGAHVNVVGTVTVLEAVRRRSDRIGHLVYASSIAALGGDVPSTLYGVFKRADEGTALRYAEDFGVPSIGLRPHTVFGPGRDQGLTSAPTTAMLAAAARVPFHVPFGGAAQFQYAPDVGEAFARAALLTDVTGAGVHNLDGVTARVAEVLALLGRDDLTCGEEPLPFPAQVDASSFTGLMAGPVCRPLADGVADAVARFERLLDEGVVEPPGS